MISKWIAIAFLAAVVTGPALAQITGYHAQGG